MIRTHEGDIRAHPFGQSHLCTKRNFLAYRLHVANPAAFPHLDVFLQLQLSFQQQLRPHHHPELLVPSAASVRAKPLVKLEGL